MRKGLLLTQRDHELLRHLSLGPSTVGNIFKYFFNTADSNPKTRERVMQRRLRKLEQEDLIRSISSPIVSDRIYALTSHSASIVANDQGIELSNVWVNPNVKNIKHDLYVAGAAKKIYRESEELKLYKLTFLQFEYGLRRIEKLRKGVYLPDIIFAIQGLDNKHILDFNLEVDCGTISRKDFLGKIKYFRDTPLVIINTQKRLSLLKSYLKAARIAKHVYLTTFEEFFYTALPECNWHTNFSENPIKLTL